MTQQSGTHGPIKDDQRSSETRVLVQGAQRFQNVRGVARALGIGTEEGRT